MGKASWSLIPCSTYLLPALHKLRLDYLDILLCLCDLLHQLFHGFLLLEASLSTLQH